jgi:hypothetical protein
VTFYIVDRYNTNNVCVIDELCIEGVVGKIEEDELVKFRLQEGIYKLLGIAIDVDDIEEGYVGFIRDEIQGEAIPEYVMDVLAEPVMAESFGYRDGKNDYYEVCHLYYVGPNPYEVWLKNDEVIKGPLEQPAFFRNENKKGVSVSLIAYEDTPSYFM